jgi:hypothetical protein
LIAFESVQGEQSHYQGALLIKLNEEMTIREKNGELRVKSRMRRRFSDKHSR